MEGAHIPGTRIETPDVPSTVGCSKNRLGSTPSLITQFTPSPPPEHTHTLSNLLRALQLRLIKPRQ